MNNDTHTVHLGSSGCCSNISGTHKQQQKQINKYHNNDNIVS
jgi:hypothetical protein